MRTFRYRFSSGTFEHAHLYTLHSCKTMNFGNEAKDFLIYGFNFNWRYCNSVYAAKAVKTKNNVTTVTCHYANRTKTSVNATSKTRFWTRSLERISLRPPPPLATRNISIREVAGCISPEQPGSDFRKTHTFPSSSATVFDFRHSLSIYSEISPWFRNTITLNASSFSRPNLRSVWGKIFLSSPFFLFICR
jgi:hypothetical protein